MGKFDDSWKDVFQGAEVSPAESVWAGIDRDLTFAEGSEMRRVVVFYQRVAAAAVFLAFVAASFLVYRWNEGKNQLAYQEQLEGRLKELENQKAFEENKATVANRDQKISTETVNANARATAKASDSESTTATSHGKQTTTDQVAAVAHHEMLTAVDQTPAAMPVPKKIPLQKENYQRMSYAASLDIDGPGIFPVKEISGGPVEIEIVRKLPWIPAAFMVHTEKKSSYERRWASFSAATGGYSTSSNPYLITSSSAATQGPSSYAGSSYSVGMIAGTRIGNRVIIQSGIQYLNQSLGTSSNINSPNGLSQVNSATASSYGTTTPYDIRSANEFVSVPMQAGYLLLDKRFAFQLNSGLSTDFFLRNTLTDPSGVRQGSSQGSGAGSPYRLVNFSGLMNSELSYKMGSRYRLSVVPGIRYPFNSIFKSESTTNNNPMQWDVALRFRYIFR